jgi:SulP family sulfate permease
MFSASIKSLKHEHSSTSIKSNMLAGLTVGIIALPLSMALAIASGVPPQHGLYTAIIAGIFIALSGGSQVNISGPTAAFVVVLLPIVHTFGIGGLLISGFLAGVILVLMGITKLGRLIEIVPYSVIVGFTAGIGAVIATFQIKDFFGLQVELQSGHYFDKITALVNSFHTISADETLIGIVTILVLIFWSKLKTRIPGHLVAILVGALLAWGLSVTVDGFSVATIGSRFHYDINGLIGNGIPPVLPHFGWPWELHNAQGEPIGISFGLIKTLLPSAFAIAILGAIESLLCAVVADGMSGKKHNPNDELIGQGIGNMIAPLFGGIPATAAIARTSANVRAGGSSPLSSVTHSLFIIIAIVSLAPMLAYIPMSSMAALLLVIAWNMADAKHFMRTLKVAPKNDVLVLLTCFTLTVLFDMTIAVGVGISLSALLFVHKSMDSAETVLMRKERHNYENLPNEVAVYDINGPLFFGTAQKALKNLTDITPEVSVVVLDMSEVTMIDMSAIVAMESIVDNLSKNDVSLIITNLRPRMIAKLNRVGIEEKQNEIIFSNNLTDALKLASALI